MKNTIKLTLTALLLSAALISCDTDARVKKEMQKIEVQVANDMIKQYNIAVKGGDAMDAYVRAGMVAEAFLQAKDTENYKKWKAIEKQWATKVGM